VIREVRRGEREDLPTSPSFSFEQPVLPQFSPGSPQFFPCVPPAISVMDIRLGGGDYRLGRKIGAGSFSDVYSGRGKPDKILTSLLWVG